MSQPSVILASTSPFRRQILAKLAISFESIAPICDETPKKGESAQQLVERLAIDKAKSIKAQHPNALIIGSDQVAVYNQEIIGKPHTSANAIKQLQQFSAQAITFYTGLCVYNSQTDEHLACVEPFTVHFRPLSDAQIHYYVNQEQPLNSAGSFKSEGLGISLFERLEGDDPNTLIGLPLIKLTHLLAHFGLDVLNPIQ